jgi:hypothetical protein
MAKRKKSNPVAAPERSEVIAQCVIYLQQLASYDAGFKADATGDSEYAGRGSQIGKAKRALGRLVGLSPACIEGKPKLVSENVGSHSACSTCITACWMKRSSTVGMPSSRTPPDAFGISTRRTGCGL